ncbi:MAG: F0F1 ATP synthase subunit delta, partial [Gammaproteobacteria bacterium]
LDQARQDANALRVERQEALKCEQQHLNAEIARRTREEVYAIARKTLTDLAGVSLEARMSEVFTRRLQALDHETKDDFVAAVKTSSQPVLVRSAFELSAEQRAAIQIALNATMSVEIPIRYETVPDVISGIELSAKGRKIAWSIADYLGSLELSVGDLLAPSNPQAKTEAESQSAAQSAAREQTE